MARRKDLDEHRMTPKQAAFCRHFKSNGGKVFEAYKSAGYSVNSETTARTEASRLMKHPAIIAELARYDQVLDKEHELNKEYVVQKLIKIVEDTQDSSPTAALRGLELLGKELGMFKDRQEISGPDGEAIKYEQKVKEDVNDFTLRLQQLTKQSRANQPSDEAGSDAGDGEGTVVKLPKRG